MRGVIILDGPDAVGKTTLARKLLDGDDAGYIHLTYDPKWDDPDRTLWRMQFFAMVRAAVRFARGKLTVIDRHWMSEQIYARVYRDGTMMNGESRGWDRVVQRLCGVYVICAPAPASAWQRHRKTLGERPEMYKSDDEILRVADRYRSLWFGQRVGPVRDYVEFLSVKGMCGRPDAVHYDIDHEANQLDEVIGRIKDQLFNLQRLQYNAAFDISQSNYLGHLLEARILFVGERINPKKSGYWPFIGYGASSRVISDALQGLNFNERHGLWTNAIADDLHVRRLVEILPSLKVIALGSLASYELEKIGVDHRLVYHPSFVMRFNQREQFQQSLGEAMI